MMQLRMRHDYIDLNVLLTSINMSRIFAEDCILLCEHHPCKCVASSILQHLVVFPS